MDWRVDGAGGWDAAQKAIADAHPEPVFDGKWTVAVRRIGGESEIATSRLDMAGLEWREYPQEGLDGETLRVDRAVRGGGIGLVFVRRRFTADAARRLSVLFSASGFAAVYVNGREVYRGWLDGTPASDAESVEADFAAGANDVVMALVRRPGACSAYLRVGSASAWRRKIATLVALQRMFPSERERVAAAQSAIAAALRGVPGREAQAETELRRLYVMASGMPGCQAQALQLLGEGYAAAGRYDWRLEAFEKRMESLSASRADEPAAFRRAVTDFAAAACASGRLDEAVAALEAAIADEPAAADLRLALARAMQQYSLAERARAAYAEVNSGALGGLEEQYDSGIKALAAIKPNPAFLDLNHTAAARLESARDLAAQGAFERAAAALGEAFDAPGQPLVPAEGGAAGVTQAAEALFAKYPEMAGAWTAWADANPLRGSAQAAEVIARRPRSAAARAALMRIAREAAAGGRYGLSALAARRATAQFGPSAEAAALAVSGLATSGDVEGAREILAATPEAVLAGEAGAANAARLTAILESAERAARASYDAGAAPGAGFEVLWRQALEPSGLAGDAGRTARPAPVTPKATGALYEGRLYVVDGDCLRAIDCATGRTEWRAGLPLGPGTRLLDRDCVRTRTDAPAQRLVFAAPAGAAAGAGRVYASWRSLGEGGSVGSFAAAFDARSGRLLWTTPALRAGESLSFVSAPAFGHDRVYLVARLVGDLPGQYLVALDAADGSPVFARPLSSSYGVLSTIGWWDNPQIDPTIVAPAPAVSGGEVFVATNAGAAFAVDALTGLVKRAAVYERSVLNTPEDGLVALLAGRPVMAPAVAGDLAAFAPNDTAEVLFTRGPVVTPALLPGAREVAGFAGSVAVCVSARLRGVDVETGRTVWTSAENLGRGVAGSAVRDGVAYVPAEDGMRLLSAEDGKPLARYAWPDGVPRGNVIVDGDTILAFGEGDVAAYRLPGTAAGVGSRDAAGAAQVSQASGALDPAPVPLAPGPAAAGIWAAPASARACLIETGDSLQVVAAGPGEERLFALGRRVTAWDVSQGGRPLWSAAAPFKAAKALYSGGRLVAMDDWQAASFDGATGDPLWVVDLPRSSPAELATKRTLHLAASGDGRIGCVAGNMLVIIDAETGEALRTERLAAKVVGLAGGEGVFAALISQYQRAPMLRVYDAASGAVRAVRAAGSVEDFAAAVRIAEGRIIVCSPARSEVLATDLSGRTLWRRNGTPQLAALVWLEAAKGWIAFAGREKGGAAHVVVLDARTGAQAAGSGGAGPAALTADEAYVVNGNGTLARHVRGEPAARYAVALGDAQGAKPPVGLCAAGDAVYALFADEAQPGKMSLGVYDAETGACRARSRLPLSAGDAARIEALSAQAFVAAGREAAVRAAWADAEASATALAYCGATGATGESAWMGSPEPAHIVAGALGGAVVDGDLAEWRSCVWTSVALGDGERAAVAFAARPDALIIAVRTRGAGSAESGREMLRIALGAGGDGASAPKAGWLIMESCILDLSGNRLDSGIVARRRSNALGGFDLEAAIPWSRVGAKAGEVPGGLFALLCGIGTGGAWTWPQGCRGSSPLAARVELSPKPQ